MTLRSYLIMMTIATLICWTAFIFVLWTVNPEITNLTGFLLFYVSLFLSLIGTSAIIGFLIRFIGMRRALAFRLVKDAFRQSFLFAFFIISVLLLLAAGMLNWLNLILLIIGLSVLEFFLISYRKTKPVYYHNNELGE